MIHDVSLEFFKKSLLRVRSPTWSRRRSARASKLISELEVQAVSNLKYNFIGH